MSTRFISHAERICRSLQASIVLCSSKQHACHVVKCSELSDFLT